MFKSLKDARRRAVESVLETVGVAEKTVDEEYDIHYDKFKAMIADMNECGSTLTHMLAKQKEFVELSAHYSKTIDQIYRKNIETNDWPGVRCQLELLPATAAYAEAMENIEHVIRTSVHTVNMEYALQPVLAAVTKMGPEIEEECKDRNAKVKDFDSYRRRLKTFEQKKESLQAQNKPTAEVDMEISRYESKLQSSEENYTKQNSKTKEDIIAAKKAHDQLLETFVITSITCQAEFMRQAAARLDQVVAMLPSNRSETVRKQVGGYVKQDGVKAAPAPEMSKLQKGMAIFTGKAMPSDFQKTEQQQQQEQLQRSLELERAKMIVENEAQSKVPPAPAPSTSSTVPPPPAASKSTTSNNQNHNHDNTSNPFAEEIATPSAPLPKVVALFDNEAEEADELSFKEGDVVEVLEMGQDGWWKGRCHGKEGLFPVNYVKNLD